MFISQHNTVVYPQSEHLKLATVIAEHWGNDEFNKPPVPSDSFIKAVACHDDGYGHYDTSVVGQQTEEAIEKVWTRCATQKLNDIYAEIIIKRHFMRLAGLYESFPRLAALRRNLEQEISYLYKKHEFDTRMFDITDTVMNLCDAVAFSFCREETATREVKVYKEIADEVPISMSYTIDDNHTIHLDPYPLDEALITGTIIAYDKEEYPKVLLPNDVNYQIMNKP